MSASPSGSPSSTSATKPSGRWSPNIISASSARTCRKAWPPGPADGPPRQVADRDNPLEPFRHALAGAARALAHDPEVEVGFTSDHPGVTGKSVKAPMPGRTLTAREVAEARGFADAAALRLRHHDEKVHRRGAPADETA